MFSESILLLLFGFGHRKKNSFYGFGPTLIKSKILFIAIAFNQFLFKS